jgi:hypothetical protein
MASLASARWVVRTYLKGHAAAGASLAPTRCAFATIPLACVKKEELLLGLRGFGRATTAPQCGMVLGLFRCGEGPVRIDVALHTSICASASLSLHLCSVVARFVLWP